VESVEKNVPMLRFKGFTDDWTQRKLGEIVLSLRSGLSRMLSNEDIGLPVVRANNIVDGKFDMDNDVKYWYVDDPQGAQTSNYFVYKDDILINFINSESRMGTATIVDENPLRDTIYTTNILNFRTNEYATPYFVFTMTFSKKYQDYISSITKPAVSQASFTTVDFKNYVFGCPSVTEQTAIGTFFRTLDELLAATKRQIALLKQLKKAYLQQLFPQKGEKIPEIRFSGFAGEWNSSRLEEIFDIGNGYTPSKANEEFWEGGTIPWFRMEDIRVNGRILSDSIQHITEKAVKGKLFPANSIIISTTATIGEHALIIVDSLANQRFTFISINVNCKYKIDSYFVFYASYSLANWCKANINSGGLQAVDMAGFKQYEFSFPTIEEQKKISELFLNIDVQIKIQTKKLESLKHLKSAYLQKMFV